MSAFQPSPIAKDFQEVFQFLATKLALPNPPPAEMLEVAKRIHASTYSLIAWKFWLKGMPYRARVYMDEVASDALQILPQILAGYSKTAKLLMRGVIENTLRHIYFYDHAVEFTRINSPGKWRISVASMFEFLLSHPEFELSEPRFNAVGRLSALYSELSLGVHGRSIQDLETKYALQAIKFNADKADEDSDLLTNCASSVNFLLAIFHHEKVCMFAPADKRLIMRTMPPKARTAWKEHEPSPEMKAART